MPRPELEPLLQLMRTAPEPNSIAEMRVTMEATVGFLNSDLPELAGYEAAVPIADGITADVLVPSGRPPLPVLLYLHGGGWSIGSPATHAKLTRELAVPAGALTVSVAYRLSPENPFPRPLDDCVAAVRWVREHVGEYGGDPKRLAIGGDSAGGNLSAAVINDLRGEVEFRAALLLYGAYDLEACWRDYDRWAPEEDPVLRKRPMKMMLDSYLSGGARTDDARVSPLHADLSHFPPALLQCGTWDPLYGDSIAMRDKLQAAGREATFLSYAEMPHAFMQLPCTEGARAIADACEFLRRRLNPAR